MSNGIEFRKVSKRYGGDERALPAVKGISFEVPQGTLTTILGPSGCGKTTTLRMIAGLRVAALGHHRDGWVAGRDHTGPKRAQRQHDVSELCVVPAHERGRKRRYGLRVSGATKKVAARRANAALKGVGLVGFDERLLSELSGGQQQGVALARALVLEPAVLLFDEPLSNLDARLRREMRDEIRAIQQRLQLTVAYVTHDQSEALAVSDQIIVMDHGVIAQRGTPAELYGRPASEFVAGFMGEAVVFSATAHQDGQMMLGPLTLQPCHPVARGAVKVAARPEAWRIGAASGLPATCIKTSYLGRCYEYRFDTPIGAVFVVSKDLAQPLAAGAQTQLALAAYGVSMVPGAV